MAKRTTPRKSAAQPARRSVATELRRRGSPIRVLLLGWLVLITATLGVTSLMAYNNNVTLSNVQSALASQEIADTIRAHNKSVVVLPNGRAGVPGMPISFSAASAAKITGLLAQTSDMGDGEISATLTTTDLLNSGLARMFQQTAQSKQQDCASVLEVTTRKPDVDKQTAVATVTAVHGKPLYAYKFSDTCTNISADTLNDFIALAKTAQYQ